jgi:hypothetical protein
MQVLHAATNGYSRTRPPDPRLALRLRHALGSLLDLDEYDAGYRLVIAEPSAI